MPRISLISVVAVSLAVPATAGTVGPDTERAFAHAGSLVVVREVEETWSTTRADANAVTAGVHEDGLPTPPLGLVLAAASLGGILLLRRRDRGTSGG